jgi:hypothetical protein
MKNLAERVGSSLDLQPANTSRAEHTLGADGQVVAIGGDELEEEREVIVFNVGVDELFAVAVYDADIHLAGMQVDSAVELCGGGVILHSDHSLWGRKTPV